MTDRKRIEADVRAYLRNGGEITKLPMGATGDKYAHKDPRRNRPRTRLPGSLR